MYKLTIVVLATLCSVLAYAQDITGDWNALLKVSGQELPLVFHIAESDDGYTGTLDSPKQAAMGLEMSTVTYSEKTVTFALTSLGISYEGLLQDSGDIVGTFSQGGLQLPLNLSRGEAKVAVQNRPQEPKAPFPYRTEEVTFPNEGAQLTLAGTLSLPKALFPGRKKFPAVILISGSGAQNRDEELLGHKPFLVIADYLTRQGIAVLRYDDRGTAASTGKFEGATSADFATDAQAAFDFLLQHKEIDPDKIGFAGHSEGGFIAPMVAAKNKKVAFIALLAGVVQPGDELLTEQAYLIGKAQGANETVLQKSRVTSQHVFGIIKKHHGDTQKIRDEIISYLETALAENPDLVPQGSTAQDLIKQQVGTITTKWFQYFISTDPRPTLEQVTCPVLAMNGSLDLQVPSKQNLEAIEQALKKGGNTQVTIAEIPNLNHLFQTTSTGSPAEYATLEETFSPKALTILGDWITKTTK